MYGMYKTKQMKKFLYKPVFFSGFLFTTEKVA